MVLDEENDKRISSTKSFIDERTVKYQRNIKETVQLQGS